MAKMKELQAYVNMITVGMKYGQRGTSEKDSRYQRRSIKALRDELSSMP